MDNGADSQPTTGVKSTVSVIIPTYNRAGRLHVSVESVMAQTYRPIELLVIDDGSTDDTPAAMQVLEQRAREAGLSTVFVRQANGGCASARNAGLERATGEWISFLDDDDRWMPDKLEKQLALLAKTGAKACCAQVLKKAADSERVRPETAEGLINGHEPARYIERETEGHLITIMFHRSLLPQVGAFDTTLRISSDTEWIARLCHVADFCAVPEVLAVYEWSETALSRARDLKAKVDRSRIQLRKMKLIKQRCSSLRGWDEDAWRRRMSQQYSTLGRDLLHDGQISEASKVYHEGVKLLGPLRPLRKLRHLLWKARILGPFGWRLRHPSLR